MALYPQAEQFTQEAGLVTRLHRLTSAQLLDAVALAVVAALLLFHWRVNSAWLVLGGALVGLLMKH